MIEASWGLGEAVVSGRVIPDSFRVARGGEVLERRAGAQEVRDPFRAGRRHRGRGVAPDLVESLCLSDEQLQALSGLADDCERVYGAGRDIEWAFADGQLYLLQCRAVTRSAGVRRRRRHRHAAGLGRVNRARAAVLRSRRARSRRHRATVHPAGVRARRDRHQGGVGRRGVLPHRVGHSHGDRARCVPADLGAGDYFGEIALIDGGARSATVTADGELVCQGITLWDFQPLVQRNPTMAWTLLQTLAGMLRQAGRPRTA